jgi:hypothetical protein
MNPAHLDMIRGPEWMMQTSADSNDSIPSTMNLSLASLFSKTFSSLSSETVQMAEDMEGEESLRKRVHQASERTHREIHSMDLAEFRAMKRQMYICRKSARQLLIERITTNLTTSL